LPINSGHYAIYCDSTGCQLQHVVAQREFIGKAGRCPALGPDSRRGRGFGTDPRVPFSSSRR
jgi:hypothetical protein